MIESQSKFWEEIYLRNIGKMIGICYRYTSNRQLAEDLAHDAFLKAINKSDSFKGDGVFDAWLRRVVVNHVLTYIRDKKRHQQIDDWLHNENDVSYADSDNVLDQSEANEFSAKELLDVINDLPEHHRVVFNLYVIDDFKHAQIAEILGISEGTSKSHLARARKKIRQLLAEKDKDRKRTIFLLLLPRSNWSIDRLYNKQFRNFEFVHHKPLPDFSNVPGVPMSLSQASTSWIGVAASVVGGLIAVSTIIYLMRKDNNVQPHKAEFKQGVIEDSAGSDASRAGKQADVVPVEKNNSQKADSNNATFRRTGVIQSKTIKTDRMKTLDSLGLAVLISTALVVDSAAQSIVKVNTSTTDETKPVVLTSDPTKTTNVVQFSAPAKSRRSEKQEGTFYATSLHWSAENNELYFKGKVKVDVGENHFVSTGSVTFLGKVYMLILDGTPVKPDSKIELSQQQYRLKQLSNREAVSKYGESGENGAVEINVIDEY